MHTLLVFACAQFPLASLPEDGEPDYNYEGSGAVLGLIMQISGVPLFSCIMLKIWHHLNVRIICVLLHVYIHFLGAQTPRKHLSTNLDKQELFDVIF